MHTTYDNIKQDGSYSFDFTTNISSDDYDQIVLLVETNNNYANYHPEAGYIATLPNGNSNVTTISREGIILNYNPINHVFTKNYSDIKLNRRDGCILRNSELSGEFFKERYKYNLPFLISPIDIYIYNENTSESAYFYYMIFGIRKIMVNSFNSNAYVTASTIMHEFGHYIHYYMYGQNALSSYLLPNNLSEGFAIFYAFAGVNYANKKYGDNLEWEDIEIAGYRMEPYRYYPLSYSRSNSDYPAFACYLWNIYDGTDDGDFKAWNYSGRDNDDVSGLGMRVFETMRNLPSGSRSVGDFHNRFKDGLDNRLRTSIDKIYDYTVNNNINSRIYSAQIKNPSASLQSNSITFQWESGSYQGWDSYINREDAIKLYRQSSIDANWDLVATLPNINTNYTYQIGNPMHYNYKLTASNSSGDSYNEKIFNYKLNVAIEGPGYIATQYISGTFNAIVSGGNGNYNYNWSLKYGNSNEWNSEGNGSSTQIWADPLSYRATLKLTVTSGSQQATIYKDLAVVRGNGSQFEDPVENQFIVPAPNNSIINQETQSKYAFAKEIGDVIIFPNPASSFLSISFDCNEGDKGTLLITDITGATMKTLVKDNIILPYYNINLSDLPNGKYFLTSFFNSRRSFTPFIISK